ncbi:MAG TPA: hypothetical protein VMV69_03150 [Pirellulales bacterium]|nr:hypothetical protein [Pirellulales bacterium]
MPFQRIRTVLFVGFSLSFGAVATGADEDPLAQFHREYPTAAALLRQRFAHARGDFSFMNGHPNASPSSTMTGAFCVDHGRGKISGKMVTPRGSADVVICSGRERGFVLMRDDGQPAYGVRAAGTVTGPQKGPHDSLYADAFGDLFAAPFALLSRPLIEIVSDAEMLRAERVELNGDACVQIWFRRRGGAIEWTVTLDAEHDWLIRDARLQRANEEGGNAHITVEYADVSTGIPKSVAIQVERGTRSCAFTTCEFAETPESEFTLSFYGMPDLNAPPRKPRALWWLLGSGVLAVVAALLLRRRAK